jgi:hypothetical protein
MTSRPRRQSSQSPLKNLKSSWTKSLCMSHASFAHCGNTYETNRQPTWSGRNTLAAVVTSPTLVFTFHPYTRPVCIILTVLPSAPPAAEHRSQFHSPAFPYLSHTGAVEGYRSFLCVKTMLTCSVQQIVMLLAFTTRSKLCLQLR